MSVEQFMAAVLPSQGLRYALNTFGVQGDDNFRPMQRTYDVGREEQLLATARRASKHGANAYFATGGFAPLLPEHIKPKTHSGRTADRVQWMRCLRLDIDCGDDKAYADKRAGLQALGEFCAKYNLITPWLVDSGYGIHAYWSFDRDVMAQQWLGLAQQLATACVAAGFDVDTTSTLDLARVLRVPGTCNHKRGESVPVRLINVQAAPVSPDVLSTHLPVSTMPAMQIPGGAVDELSANMHQPYFLRGVLTQCPGMMAMLENGGANAREPLWKMSLDLIHKAADPIEVRTRVARNVSSGHPGFSDGALAAKWRQVQRQDYHPPTCRAMAGAGMPECATCPFNGKISSPLALGRVQLTQPLSLPAANAAVAPPLPPTTQAVAAPAPPTVSMTGVFGVSLGSNRVTIHDGAVSGNVMVEHGMPCLVTKSKGGSKDFIRPLMPYKLLEVERLLDDAGHKSMIALTFDRNSDGIARIELTHGDMTDARAFHGALQAGLLHISRKSATDMMEMFMPDFLSQLQQARAASQIAGRCGWTDDMSAFVLGTRLFTAAGESHIRPGAAPEEMEAYHEMGDPVAWRHAFEIVMDGGPDRQAVLALALASPLMAFTGLDGVMLNAFSPESGVGKSTLGDTALSIWGSPAKLRKNFRDTANATFKIAGVVGNLPMVIDEFTNVEGKALSDFVYTVTQGREKHRLTSDARLAAGGSQRWCLAAITTANNSVHDKLQAYRSDAVAEAARVFEIRLRPLDVPLDRMGPLKAELQALRNNYGFLGAHIARMLLGKPPAYWQGLVSRKISEWDQSCATNTGDRFRSATSALVEIGALLGKAMGYNFDVEAIKQVMRAEWMRQVDEFEHERKTPADFINDYLLAHNGEIMVIGGVNGDALVSSQRRYFAEIRGRTVDGKFRPSTVMIPLDLLRTHVRDNNGNYKAVQEWLKSQWGNNGVVLRMGRLVYLAGQFQSFTTQAVEFSPEILGTGLAKLVPMPTQSVPSTPAIAGAKP